MFRLWQPTVALLALCTVWLGSCARCSDEPRVPFKLNPQTVDGALAPPALGSADAGFGRAQAFTPPRDRPPLEGGSLPLDRVRALLEVDLDADGDRDALALAEEGQHASLYALTRDGAGFSAARMVSGFEPALSPGCTLGAAHFEPLSASKATLALTFGCDALSAPGAARASITLLSLELAPRVYERIDLLAGERAGEPALTLTPHSLDADGDGHDDIGLTVAQGAGPEHVELVWLDRPSGLVRDIREPEATFSAGAAAAQSLSGKAPEQATTRAELTLSLQRALCRELGSPQVALSGAPGIPCGHSKSTATLLTTRVLTAVRRGDVRAAFESYRKLRHLDARPDPKQLDQAQAALLKLPAEPLVSLRRGPTVDPIRAPRVHLPSARFVGESLLYVQRARPVLYDLERNEESAAPGAADPLVRDPSGQLIASSVERTCEGPAIRIERAPPRGSDYVSAPPVALAPLVQMASVPGCTRTVTRPDESGYSVLGWAPQGVVAVRGSEVLLVPLSPAGAPVGPARMLAPEAPRPAPLPSGIATADGARYVEATAHGVLVYGPSSQRVELWRPEGYTSLVQASLAQGQLEAALSPSARRVALVAGGAVYLLERAAVR